MPEVVRDALARATQDLADVSSSPRLDAEVLLGHVLGVSRARLVLDAAQPLPAQALERFSELVSRRARSEPVAYLTGSRAFRHLTLAVDPRVLIPRPETELLVEVGLSLAPGSRVVDVGTGSGAVALALKQERPDLEVWGSDVSPDALELASANAAQLGLQVGFVVADLLDGLRGPWDAVLANLPYVAVNDELPPDVAAYEPGSALYGGSDGLAVIRRLIGMVTGVPVVALEVGLGQSGAVAELLRAAGLADVAVLDDLAGIARVVVGRRE